MARPCRSPQNQALFSCWALPSRQRRDHIQSSRPARAGPDPRRTGAGPFARTLGNSFGEENHTLQTTEIPAHTHAMSAGTLEGDSITPVNALPTKSGVGDARFGAAAAGVMAPGAVVNAGLSQAHTNTMPYLAMIYCIALQGIFPSHP